jgi:K+-sensing histidine kinase KdpD
LTQERTAATAHIGGSGLGMSIVKRLVDMMGGRISIKSELGKGTEVTVCLDLERSKPLPQMTNGQLSRRPAGTAYHGVRRQSHE